MRTGYIASIRKDKWCIKEKCDNGGEHAKHAKPGSRVQTLHFHMMSEFLLASG